MPTIPQTTLALLFLAGSACGSSASSATAPAYSVAGTYVAMSGDGIENLQFTDATHYAMLRNVCAVGDSCWENGTYALANDGSAMTFTPDGAAAYSYPLSQTVAASDDAGAGSTQASELTLQGGSSLTNGSGASLTHGTSPVALVAEEGIKLAEFVMSGQVFTVPNAEHVNVGFASPSSGETADLESIHTFWKDAKYKAGAHVCHVYLPWDLVTNLTSDIKAIRANFDAYLPLTQTDGGCDEVLVSFKTQVNTGCTADLCPGETHGNPTSPADYGTAVRAFLKAYGKKASFSFSAWNEPNNSAPAGSGTGNAGATAFVIEPQTAAKYYLELRDACGSECKVAAGDFASVGTCTEKYCMDDFQQNCPDDTVAPSKLCAKASYLDRYKNAIASYAKDYHLKEGFRPEYFAYHGWREANDFVYGGKKNCQASDCASEAIVEALGGSWRHAAIWNTEVGSGQTKTIDDKVQAEGAALILDLAASISSRIERVDYQGVRGDGWDLLCSNGKKRPAYGILLDRKTSYTGKASNVCGD